MAASEHAVSDQEGGGQVKIRNPRAPMAHLQLHAGLTRESWNFAARIFALQLIIAILTVGVLGVLSFDRQRHTVTEDRKALVSTVALSLANDPFIRETLEEPDPSRRLEPYVERLRQRAGTVDFITVMTPEGLRVTHPDSRRIGEPYIGSIEQALRGETQVEQYTGTLGPSVRAITPVHSASGEIVGMVAVGVTLQSLRDLYYDTVPQLIVVSLAVFTLAALLAWAYSRYVQRATLGFGPGDLKRLYAFYFSALHSVREGLVLLDNRHRIVLNNDEAARILNLPQPLPPQGLDPRTLSVPEPLLDLMLTGRAATDELLLTDTGAIATSQAAATVEAELLSKRRRRRRALVTRHDPLRIGYVVSMRDLSQVQELTGQVQSLQTLTLALRAQTHEHANRLHTIVTMIENGQAEKARDFALLDQSNAQALTDRLVGGIDDSYLSSLLVAKTAEAHERGVSLRITTSGTLAPDLLDASDLITIVGNLLDNALDASVGTAEATVYLEVTTLATEVMIEVADSGAGIDPAFIDRVLRLGVSSKPGERPRGFGLALVQQAVARLGGSLHIDNDAGAIFTVTLPLPHHPAEPTEPTERRNP